MCVCVGGGGGVPYTAVRGCVCVWGGGFLLWLCICVCKPFTELSGIPKKTDLLWERSLHNYINTMYQTL